VGAWSLAGFDWVKFRELAPELRRAVSPNDLRTSDDPQIADVAAAFDDTYPTPLICNVAIVELCTTPQWVTFKESLPEIVLTLRKRSASEDAADIIAELALSAHNVEPWFEAERGLMGILTRTEVEHLSSHLVAYSREKPDARPPSGLIGWARRLKPITSQGDLLDELLSVVEAASAERLGLAAILEP